MIGCAVAQALSHKGYQPIILERKNVIADGVTSRNSGVIHSGLYYPPRSLKTEMCIQGQTMLYEWCQKYNVPFKKTGKWIIGNPDDEADMTALYENAKNSGVTSLQWIPTDKVQEKIVGLKASLAMYASESGIVDPYEFSKSLLYAALEKGAVLSTETNVLSIQQNHHRFQIETTRGELEVDALFNCAGLFADEICKMVSINQYQIYPWRGDYFRLHPKYQFSQLIYPSKKKNSPGLGIHVTCDLNGMSKLGPDVEFSTDKEDHTSRPEKQQKFFEAASKYIAHLRFEDLSYDTCGIRPKLRSPTDRAEHDFIIKKEFEGFINLIGIESPGLTAAMAIAKKATELL